MNEIAYVVVFTCHDKGYTTDSVAAVGLDLEAAQAFVIRQAQGQKWACLSYIEGKGDRMRRITDFGESDWTEYRIVKAELVG